MNPRRSLHERLSTQRALVGFLQSHANPPVAEMAGMCGYDFLILDGEHGVFSERDYLQGLQAIAAAGSLAMVRLASHEPKAIGRYLDMGVDVIMAPNVSTAEQARALSLSMEYPPHGTRGFGASLHRATQYGLDLPAHLRAPRAGASLLVIIESAVGVANVDDILGIDGVDGAIIGPSDLAADLGTAGNFLDSAYSEAVTRVERAAIARNKILGTAPCAGSPLQDLIDRGHRVFLIGADMPLFRHAMATQVAEAKSLIEKKP